jgi:hypothetical protein
MVSSTVDVVQQIAQQGQVRFFFLSHFYQHPLPRSFAAVRGGTHVEVQGLGLYGYGDGNNVDGRFKVGAEEVHVFFGGEPALHFRAGNLLFQFIQGGRPAGKPAVLGNDTFLMFYFDTAQLIEKGFCFRIFSRNGLGQVEILQACFQPERDQ